MRRLDPVHAEPRARARKTLQDATGADAFWPAQAATLAAIVLYLSLPEKLTPGPTWLLPSVEALLLVGLVASTPSNRRRRPERHRQLAIVLVGFVSAANLFSVVMLTHFLLRGGRADGHALIFSGVELWVTNVLIFAIW